MECPAFEDANGYGREPVAADFGFDPGRRWEILDDEGNSFESEGAAAAALRAERRRSGPETLYLATVLVETDGGYLVAVEFGYSPS